MAIQQRWSDYVDDVAARFAFQNKLTARLYKLAQFFKVPESESDLRIESLTSAEFEDVLDEVQGYVKSIDVAKELHSIGLLAHLLHHVLYYPHAGIRAKTAELVTTMVKNNPKSQQLVMEVNGLQPLLYNFISDHDATSRTKALGAIFSLIQNNKPGITAFRLANGYAALDEALGESQSIMLEREVLNLILYLLHENSSDNNILIELGFHHIMIYLAAYNDDAEVREASLRGLLVLAKDEEGGNNGQLVKNDDEVKKILGRKIESIIATEDQYVTREEIQLMDSLWNVCYNEPSSLRLKGLLVLPGEDVHAPDVASKLVEPPLRGAWAAAEVADRNSVSEEPDVASKLVEPPLRGAWAAAEAADRNSVSEEPDVASKLFEPPLRGAWAAVEAADRNFVSEKKEAPLLLNARVKNVDKLKQVLRELKVVLHEQKQVPQERIERIISAMKPEDLSATRVERHIVDSLWNACYNDGVLELFGMAACEHYAANKLFEPPPRAWAAADRNSVSEKKEAPLLINVGVKNRTEPTFFASTELNQPRSLFPIFRTAPNRPVQSGTVRCCSSILFGFAKRFGR